MKRFLLASLFILTISGNVFCQNKISGTVTDGREPLIGVNVYVLGTVDGCITDSLGYFSFTTKKTGVVTLCASLLGYEEYARKSELDKLRGIRITLYEQAATIDDVVVTASTYSMGKSYQFKTMDALDVVLSGNSCGDLVAALQTLPGTQKVGEDGKLYVRGGSSEECQTFINGMHVLVPYGTNTENNASRGRFSPFLFKGMSFSLGGYNGEYGQALSSVLPMETTDVSSGDKLGVSASLLNWNAGGTKAFDKSSLSFNAEYTDLGLYNEIFPDRLDWTRPYRKVSGEAQYKAEFSRSDIFKTYIGYDLTSVGQRLDDRRLSLIEHNVYANATYRKYFSETFTLFAGIANSSVVENIDDAIVSGDHFHNFRNEVHLKAELSKRFSSVLKFTAGAENYVRDSRKSYGSQHYELDYSLPGVHADVLWLVMSHFFLSVSARAEQLTYNHCWEFMPRATLSFVPGNRFQMSAAYGRYSQAAEDDYIVRSQKKIGQNVADHAILSLQYNTPKTILRIEPYYKKYLSLPLLSEGIYTGDGHGVSKGVDFFIQDASLLENLTVTASYSFNDSERLWLDYAEARTPDFASRHNLRLSAKYPYGKLIFGITESYASGRECLAGKTPGYNSLDGSLTWLINPKIILYASLNNILGRKNIFRYKDDGTAITASRDRTLYVGIFISLKNTKAYDISNF